MKSTYETEIDGPQAKVAELYSNPSNFQKWMTDMKCEHISGAIGKVGSKYRFVPKKGDMEFTATFIEKSQGMFKMKMEGANVDVMVTASFSESSPAKTRFSSEEVFTFKGIINKMVGFFSGAAMKAAHTKHMKAFKKFATAELSRQTSSSHERQAPVKTKVASSPKKNNGHAGHAGNKKSAKPASK